MTAPTVSIVLPARNAARTVDRAVHSLLVQTFADFELLAIDDGSTDLTRAHLERHAATDARVRVLTTSGVGLVGALNLGLAQARAPLLARMDADDESLPRRLEQSVAALAAHPEWAGVGTGVEIWREDRPPSPNLVAYGRWLSSLTTPEKVFLERFVESPLCHPSVLLRVEALRGAGGWREGPFPEDWELWLRLLEGGARLCCLPEVLHRWADHDARLTRTDQRYAHAAHLDLRADYLHRALAPRRIALAGATEIGRGLALRLAARGAHLAGFVDLDPRKIGQRIHGLEVHHPTTLGALEPCHVLCCVAAKGVREDLRAWLTGLGKREGEDFTVVA